MDVPLQSRPSALGLVLSGGGARAAYQVGFLRFVAHNFPELRVDVYTGVSAGAINAAFLAAGRGRFEDRVENLVELWSNLEVGDVFSVSPGRLWSSVLRWGLALVSGGHGRPRRRGMVDTQPLRDILLSRLCDADGNLLHVEERLRKGELDALALTTSSYATGRSVTWVQGHEIRPWRRAHRIARSTRLGVDHILASASLPMFFPAVRIDDAWYGDGGLRLTAPLAPAIHLGARRIVAVSTRYGASKEELDQRRDPEYPPPAQVAGQLLSALFLDTFDADVLRLERINRLLEATPPERRGGLNPIEFLLLRPSQDLGRLANEYEARLPYTFRFLTRGFGTRETRSNDLLSLVMFQSDYLRRLLELGHADAEARAPEIRAFLARKDESAAL